MSDEKPRRKRPDILTLAMRRVYRERMGDGKLLPRIRVDNAGRESRRKAHRR